MQRNFISAATLCVLFGGLELSQGYGLHKTEDGEAFRRHIGRLPGSDTDDVGTAATVLIHDFDPELYHEFNNSDQTVHLLLTNLQCGGGDDDHLVSSYEEIVA